MIVVTGAYGFIGSCMVSKLNSEGHKNLILVDNFSEKKEYNIKDKKYLRIFDIKEFLKLLSPNDKNDVEFVFHIGARTDTTEFNKDIFNELNLNYSKSIWKYCVQNNIPLIYVSSAATYGDGKLGYDDDISLIPKLIPLNPYGDSKNEFDNWVLEQKETPPYWYGLKFFNVFGPNEYHKGRMSSVVYHAYNEIINTGKVELFKSHNLEYKDGEQLRDFIYVKDVIDVMYFLMNQKPKSDIYNLGTGEARIFLDLVNAVFSSLNIQPNIDFIDIPIDIRDKYQYFTEAKMNKLYSIGYIKSFYTLENAIDDYIKNYLINNKYL